MSRLPVVSADGNAWGTILNDFLSQAHNADGSIKNLFFNVKDPAYGAIGNGSTDDTAAIQAAINAVAAAGSGCIFFPGGTYKITSTLTVTTGGLAFAGASLGSVFLQPAGAISGNLITVTGANDVSIRDLTIQPASTTYSSNPAINAIQVNHSNGFRVINVNVLYNNGWALQINSDATSDSYFPHVINFHALSCASGIQLVGTNSTTHNSGAFFVDVVADQMQNGDSIQILDVHDVTISNLEGSNFSSGSMVHIKGLCAAIFLDNIDIGALTGGGAASPAPTVLIETGGLGNPKQIAFTGGIIENGSTGVTITAGTEITFNGVQFIKNGTHGLTVSGATDLVSVQQCIFDLNGFTAGAGHYDLNWGSTGHVMVTNNTFNTPGGSGSSQVASACNFTAGTSWVFANDFNAATPFTGFPTIARSNPGYNPVGNISPPAFSSSPTTIGPYGADVTAYLKGSAGTVSAVTIGGVATGLTSLASGVVVPFRIPAGLTMVVTWATTAPSVVLLGE
jgi:Pectate lyase superfamily protein